MVKISKVTSILMTAILTTVMLTGCVTVKINTSETPAGANAEQSDEVAESVADNEAENIENEDTTQSDAGNITIVYTNDVHSYIDNVVKDSDGNITGDGLRFSKIAAMVNDMKAAGENVLLVDAGDEIQGNIYGAMDEGSTIIDIMNAAGYDLATPGNHDFDYGVITLLKLAEKAEFQYISCNFHSSKSKEIVFPATKTYEMDGKKIAFIGVTTPETITSSTPIYFQDENGEFIYEVDGTADAEDLYTSVQSAIDSVSDEADYVIALGHVGVGIDEKKSGISSEDIIANTVGLSAFIDGHSHTTLEGSKITDKEGNEVVLTQTGNYLAAVGVMTIGEDGSISTELVNDYEREEDSVAEIEKQWIQDIDDRMSEKIGTLDTTLYINNPNDGSQRLIRSQELNAGDFCADAFYWFFNEQLELKCDVAIQNGGGVRSQIEQGDVTYRDAKQVEPFGNMVCLISATGQQIVDALEMGVTSIGEWDDEWNIPAENGGFMHVAGLCYTVDASIKSSVETDDNGLFKAVNGDYRVGDVKVYNRESGEYEPIDLNKEYQLGGINYILRNGGNGLSMFSDNELSIDYVGQDYVILSEYIKNFAQEDGYARINTLNSPLAGYEGYMIDYENPLGAGRINIINVSYDK